MFDGTVAKFTLRRHSEATFPFAALRVSAGSGRRISSLIRSFPFAALSVRMTEKGISQQSLDRTLKAGTRRSPLALRQAEEVIGHLKEFYPRMIVEISGIDTYGDRDKITPVSDIEGTDFWTREIEDALLRGEIDFAVHSAKDLPDKMPEGLCVAAITKSIDSSDALISKNNLKIDKLSYGAKVGASSRRRKVQLRKYRDDFQLVDIRGTIEERIARLKDDKIDAIVVATCALIRLGLEKKITEKIPAEILTPHPLQGALAVEVRKDNQELRNILEVLNGR